MSPRTLEVFDDLGIARPLIDAGLWIRGVRRIVDGSATDVTRAFPGLPYGLLAVAQNDTERVLAQHLATFGLTVERGVSLVSLEQTDDRVRCRLRRADGSDDEPSFDYVVGCDGAHSAVRKSVGIPFDGVAIPYDFMLGDVRMDCGAPPGFGVQALRLQPNGAPAFVMAVPLAEPNRYRVTMSAPPDLATPGGSEHGIQSERPVPGLHHLQAVVDDLLPGQPRLEDLRWSSLFRISARLAGRYRSGRVFLAGDAAHIHPPLGGQGMNTGIQDAYNLAWKLALVLRGHADPALLDTYASERRPVGEQVVASTLQAATSFGRPAGDARSAGLAETQLLVSYRTPGQPLADLPVPPQAGDRAPDCTGLRRDRVGFPLRLFDLLRGPEHVLIIHVQADDLDRALLDLETWLRSQNLYRNTTSPLRTVVITSAMIELLRLSPVPVYVDADGTFGQQFGPAPAAILVRPDGYLAWRGEDFRAADLQHHLQLTMQYPSHARI